MVYWKASEFVEKGFHPVSTTQVGYLKLEHSLVERTVESKQIRFSEWKQRYAILNPNAVPKGALMQPKNACEKILAGITEINADSYRFGHTKVGLARKIFLGSNLQSLYFHLALFQSRSYRCIRRPSR